MVYRIYEEFLSDVEKKLKRIAKKCKKSGNDFHYEITGEEIKSVKNESGEENYYKFILVDVEGTAKIDDWEFIATLEVYNSGNIIRRFNTDIEIPERFETTENICEHCGSKRFRNNLYIIHNTKTDEWKQVGSSCLILYTSGLNAEYVTSYMDGITELEEYDGFIGSSGKPMFSVEEIIGYATEIIDKIGYYNSESDIPTKALVGCMLYRTDSSIKELNTMLRNHRIEFNSNDFDKDSTSDRVQKIIDYYKNQESNSEFVHNIHVMLNEGYVTYKSIGYLCYLPEGYNRYMEHETAKQKQLAEEINEHYGIVGKRYNDMSVRYIKTLSCFDNGYGGCSYLCKVVLEDGHVLMWIGNGFNSSMEIKDESGHYKWVDCIPDKISFTIKDHSEYKGQKQTKITRCRIKYKRA